MDIEIIRNLPQTIRNLESDLAELKAARLDDETESKITAIMAVGSGITRSYALRKVRGELDIAKG